jgi:hypothetical protein
VGLDIGRNGTERAIEADGRDAASTGLNEGGTG